MDGWVFVHWLPLDIPYKNICSWACVYHLLLLYKHTHPSQRCQSTDVVLSLLPVQRSLQASTLHFPGCRGAGQGQDSTVFAGLMKHVYLAVCVPCGRRSGSEMNVDVCVSVYYALSGSRWHADKSKAHTSFCGGVIFMGA